MKFKVIDSPPGVPSTAKYHSYLVTDSWNDWFKYTTLFHLYIFDSEGIKHDVGALKIGEFGMGKEKGRPDIPRNFEELGDSFFSVGQDDSFYENLNAIGPEIRTEVLSALKDVAADPDLFERALTEDVMAESLLRSVKVETVRGQFRRIAGGGVRLSHFKFTYTAPQHGNEPPAQLDFNVWPSALPPTNVHVLIGRNGVGKTHLLNRMSRALIDRDNSAESNGLFEFDSAIAERDRFVNLVSVTFSVFDPFEPLSKNDDSGIQYSYVGLKFTGKNRPANPTESSTLKNIDDLAEDFEKSMAECLQSGRNERWHQALKILESDPLFAEADISSLAAAKPKSNAAQSLFRRLSSGHKIVLLTITRLVETVDEKTLVLMDEPETHLHPPLLASFVRALSNLLTDRNGVAIVATHSPVVLQEVPSACVWKLRRSGTVSVAERPDIETFGENSGVLTREIFGLEVEKSGFHSMIDHQVQLGGDFQTILTRMGESLGGEGRAILRGLLADKHPEE